MRDVFTGQRVLEQGGESELEAAVHLEGDAEDDVIDDVVEERARRLGHRLFRQRTNLRRPQRRRQSRVSLLVLGPPPIAGLGAPGLQNAPFHF